MPPRSTPPPRSRAFPPHDAATYRDLLLFEERLKTTAASLQKRKGRYQVFFISLLVTTFIMLVEVLLPRESSILLLPYRLALLHFLPSADPPQALPPLLPTSMLFVCMVTLMLFFASRLYADKIQYANRYVPHANKALRSFNMYLNVRKPSPFGKNPLSFFFGRPAAPSQTSSQLNPAGRRNSSVVLPSIPPASNPRGELIFSSRVDRNFKEGYERHRSTFERRREERRVLQLKETWWGRLMFWEKLPPPPVETPTHSRTSTLRGKGSRASSRTPTPSNASQPSTSLGVPTSPRRSVSPQSSVSSDSE
ncbi:hypothetical protein CYLTODRAFT_392824 [Cylindrobasidium torrendii FP15055 ss-10]|uniref:Transmembrane protein 188 n=1 Tax=Cylindrobasidium torrendii FP15055 ss-10 TaxID=1314674 RepID=A0A0D7BHG2_9AGAR|nr:hypothetical protein CYLTODRAFT_392824 [Cylindrobasidium torrendii FP15055 ss-10]